MFIALCWVFAPWHLMAMGALESRNSTHSPNALIPTASDGSEMKLAAEDEMRLAVRTGINLVGPSRADGDKTPKAILDFYLTSVSKTLKQCLGEPAIITFGTLLGHYRDGGVLDQDDDVDFMVSADKFPAAKKCLLDQKEFTMTDHHVNKLSDRIFMQVKTYKDGHKVHIDLYGLEPGKSGRAVRSEKGKQEKLGENEVCMLAMIDGQVWTYDSIFPPNAVEGKDFAIPRDPPLVLDAYYTNWKVVDRSKSAGSFVSEKPKCHLPR